MWFLLSCPLCLSRARKKQDYSSLTKTLNLALCLSTLLLLRFRWSHLLAFPTCLRILLASMLKLHLIYIYIVLSISSTLFDTYFTDVSKSAELSSTRLTLFSISETLPSILFIASTLLSYASNFFIIKSSLFVVQLG